MKITVSILTIVFALLLTATSVVGSQHMEMVFHAVGSDILYQARISTDRTEGDVWPQPEIRRQYPPLDSEEWSVVARISLEGLRSPEELRTAKLKTRGSGHLPVLIVYGEGDTRNWLYIAQVTPHPAEFPSIRVLLREWHEGVPRYTINPQGEIDGVELQYNALHAPTDEPFPNHVLLARRIAWDSVTRAFRKGPF